MRVNRYVFELIFEREECFEYWWSKIWFLIRDMFRYCYDVFSTWWSKFDLLLNDYDVTSDFERLHDLSNNECVSTLENIKQSSFQSQLTTISSSRWISKWFFRESSHSKSLFPEKWSAWSRASLLSLKSSRLLISREQNYFVLAARLEFDDVLNLRVCLRSCLLNKLSYFEQLEEIRMT